MKADRNDTHMTQSMKAKRHSGTCDVYLRVALSVMHVSSLQGPLTTLHAVKVAMHQTGKY